MIYNRNRLPGTNRGLSDISAYHAIYFIVNIRPAQVNDLLLPPQRDVLKSYGVYFYFFHHKLSILIFKRGLNVKKNYLGMPPVLFFNNSDQQGAAAQE